MSAVFTQEIVLQIIQCFVCNNYMLAFAAACHASDPQCFVHQAFTYRVVARDPLASATKETSGDTTQVTSDIAQPQVTASTQSTGTGQPDTCTKRMSKFKASRLKQQQQ